MIVKNEEKFLEECLLNIKDLTDEIIIVDTGSNDKTIEIAKKYTKNIFNYEWGGDFSEARNFSISKAIGDWILYIDADEIIATEDFEKIRKFIEDKDVVAYSFKQITYTNDGSIYGYQPVKEDGYSRGFEGYIECNVVRLFRNNIGIKFTGSVHESVDQIASKIGKIVITEIPIHHYQSEKGLEKEREKQLMYLEIYKKNINKFENKAKVYRDIGIINYNYLENYDEAIENFYESLRYNDKNDKTYVGLIMSFYKKRNMKIALELSEKAAKLFPNNKEIVFLYDLLRRKNHQKV